jgi:hypothetical protein
MSTVPTWRTVCPPSTCYSVNSVLPPLCLPVQCAADVTKVFRSPKQLKCYESRDTTCSTNETAMVVACRSAAGAMGAHIMVRGSDDEGLLGHTQARGGGGGLLSIRRAAPTKRQ